MPAPDMTSLVPYTAVVAQLGVGSSDISEATVANTGAYDELYLDLRSWFPRHADLLASVATDEAITAQQVAVKAYAKYYICLTVLISGRLSFYQKISDGSNDDRRFDTNFNAIKDDLTSQALRYQAMALDIVTEFTPEQVSSDPKTLMSVAAPTIDIANQ
jgi:hypothetical protein